MGPDVDCDPDTEECGENPDGGGTGVCSDDNDCSAGRYCYDDSCVSETFICTLLNCAGQPGVCDPAARECVNAEVCTSVNDCLEGNLCVANRCEPEADLCSECSENEECVYDRTNLSVSCVDPTIVCEADTRSCDGDTLVVCNANGTQEARINCREGCDGTELRCILPEADSCADAYEVVDGDSFEIDWTEFSNYYQPSEESACVPINRLFNTSGADVAFSATVPPGEQLTVSMTSAVDYGAIYLLEECVDVVESCVEPSATDFIRGEDQFVRAAAYTNDTDAPVTLTIIADTGVGTLDNPATLDFSIGLPLCEPGTYQCAEGQREVCNAFGNAYTQLPFCPFGCGAEADQCAEAPNSVCSAAVDLAAEGMTYSSTVADLGVGAQVRYGSGGSLDGDQCNFASSSRQDDLVGGTGYFSVDLVAGQRITATLAAEADMAMWISRGCPDIQPEDSEDETNLNCQRATNIAGASSTETLTYVAAVSDTFILAVQAVEEGDAEGEFVLDVSIEDPVCAGLANGSVLGCFDADTLSICNGDFPTFYGCEGGCVDGACGTPRGDRCIDAITLAPGASFEGDFANITNKLNAPSSCFEGTPPGGRDAVFAVELNANDILEATLTTDVYAGIYVLNNCPGLDTISGACEVGMLDGDAENQYVEFFAEVAGTYYVVVDAGTTATETGAFTLSLNTRQGVCAPNSTFCANGAFQTCSETGDSVVESVNCPFACNPAGTQCGGPQSPNNTCTSSLLIDASTTITDVFGKAGDVRFERNYLLTSDADCYDGASTNGRDAVYQLQLDPTEGVVITYEASSSANGEPVMYLVEDCADSTAIRTSCIASSVGDGGVIDYISEDGGTYFLIVDHTDVADLANDAFAVSFELFDTPCDTLNVQRCINGGTTIEICDERGNQELIECDYGCALDNSDPQNVEAFCQVREGDTCERPFEILTNSYTYTDSLSGYSNTYTPYIEASGTSCTGWRGAGGEVVFAVPMTEQDVLTASITSQFDGALWVTGNCDNPDLATFECVDGSDDVFGEGTETLTLSAGSTKTYFIMVDSVDFGATGTFELQVDITRAP
ncbi:hypothetical protein FRC91_16775 [Bradymonadales bacterium TMQ1]|nr:hypothetical protein FRC91_16775 [Bradymonadales bacterium TMQ1]